MSQDARVNADDLSDRAGTQRSHRRAALAVGGSLALFALLAFVLPSILFDDAYAGKPKMVPTSVQDPPMVWMFNIAIPLLSIAVFTALTVQCVKRKTLTWYWLFFVAGVASFWVETVADWAIYLTYSPTFAHYQLPFDYPWHVHDNPFFMPFAYGLYWGTFPAVVLRMHSYFSRKYGWSSIKGLVVVGIPFSIAWDLLVEGTATYFGWWTYEPPLGPHFSWVPLGGLGIQTLIVPVLFMIVWPNLVAWMAGDPGGDSPRIAKLFRFPNPGGTTTSSGVVSLADQALPPARAAWDVRYEIVKALAWISVFWWAQVTQLLPLLINRYLWGMDSVFAPFPGWS